MKGVLIFPMPKLVMGLFTLVLKAPSYSIHENIPYPCRIRTFVVDSKANIGDFLHGKIYNIMIIGYEKLRTVQELISDAQFDIVVWLVSHFPCFCFCF